MMSLGSMRAPRATAMRTPVGSARGALWLALLAGCSVINQSDGKQCKTNEECLDRFDDVGYSCESGFCTRPVCQLDDSCRSRGTRYAMSICGVDQHCTSSACASSLDCAAPGLCNLDIGVCQSPSEAGCSNDTDCMKYEGAPICAIGRCVASQCTTVADCRSDSPTIDCIAKKCEDRPWGCRGQTDDRPAPREATATLRASVINIVTRMPPVALTATACNMPTFDPECKTPLPNAKTTYDPTSGFITVTGLAQNTPFRLKVDFPQDSGLIGLDYYAVRTVRDTTQGGTLSTMPRFIVPMLAAPYDPPRTVDLDKAVIFAAVLDCQGEPAENVTLGLVQGDESPDTTVIYFGAEGMPAPNLTKTSSFGGAIIINVKPEKVVTLQARIGDYFLLDYRVTGFPGRSTVVDLYPRLYR